MGRKIVAGNQHQHQVLEVLNAIPELVYVSDVESHNLLFINTAGKERFGVTDVENQKCYKVLQNRDDPCPFCTTPLLKFDELYTWEYHNPKVQRDYFLKDRLMNWDGRAARLEIAIDISQQAEERRTLQRSLDADKMLMECVRQLYESTDLNETCFQVMQIIGRYWNADRAYIFEICGDQMSNTVEWCNTGVTPQKEELQHMDIRLLDRWKRHYFDRSECVVLENIEDLSNDAPDEYMVLKMQGIKSLVAAPLEKEGKLIGYFGMDNPHGEQLVHVAPLLHTLRFFLMSAIQRTENQNELTQLSYFDKLTGLGNRNRYLEDVRRLTGPQSAVGVVYLNLNGLKSINDKRGHVVGDSLLVECAQCICRSFAQASHYRIGGDEFIILSHGHGREEFAAQVLELKKQLVGCSCSVAIGAQWAAEMEDVSVLITSASELMFRDKRDYYRLSLSSDRYRHYNDDVLGLSKVDYLEKMLAEDAFLVYYQPKISLEDRRLTGAEALVRFRMEDGTIASPEQFVPVLEDARLISQVDFYMLDKVCAQIARWINEGKPIVPVSVNFSRYSLVEKGFFDRINFICEQYGVNRKWIQIEITETVEGMDGFDVKGCIEKLSSAGFSVSIDDFGARYANLYLFASTRFDVLKLDKSLIDDVTTNHNIVLMLEALNDFCEKLHIETVAEGVETEEQFAILQGIGIKEAQGYLFSCPINTQEYEKRYLCS